MHLARALVASFVSLLLLGCSQNDAEELVETYAARTSNAIEIDFDLDLRPTAEFYAPLVPRRERLAELPEIRQGLLDLLDLRHCDLMGLVSERNSSLGRVATPSQRLIYELKLLPELEECIAALENDPEQAALLKNLREIYQIKQSAFSAQLFNSLYNSSEMEQQFSLGEPPLATQPEQLDTGALAAMESLANLARMTDQTSWDTPNDTDQLETYYEQLYRSHFGAQWLSSFALLTQTLEQTTEAIQQRLEGRPICFNQRQNNQSDILWNVFNRYYVQSLQPYLASVDRQGQRWRDLHLEILNRVQPTVQEASHLQIFFSEEGEVWSRYFTARDRHTAAWQELLDQCGLRPGSKSQ